MAGELRPGDVVVPIIACPTHGGVRALVVDARAGKVTLHVERFLCHPQVVELPERALRRVGRSRPS